jgi:lipoprotein NlpI
MKYALRTAGIPKTGIAAALVIGLAACGVPGAASPAQQASGAAGTAGAGGSSAAASAGAAASGSASASASAATNGQLGMVLEVNNTGWQKAVGTPSSQGMVVALVIPGQPADKAGLKVGDVVTNMNGVDVTNANITNREIRKLKVGDKVSLAIARKAATAKVDLTVAPAQQIDLPSMLTDLAKKENSARAYFLKAAYGDKDAKTAQDDYSQAITLQPDFVSAYVERGTLIENSDKAKAMDDFNKAIQLDGKYEPAYVNRSVLLSSQKTYDKALEDDLKAVQLDANDPAAYTNLGIGYVNQGKPQDAMTAENKALEIDPQFGPALVYRGLMYRDASRSDLENGVRFVKDAKLKDVAQTALQKMSA